MSKTTTRQRLMRAGAPYNRLATSMVPHVEMVPEGDGELPVVRFTPQYTLFGYTREEKWVTDSTGEDGEWKMVWEEHDLGQQATPDVAREVASDWRTSLADLSGAR